MSYEVQHKMNLLLSWLLKLMYYHYKIKLYKKNERMKH